MKVFLGWSGEVSHAIALELREWLPSVIQNIDSWVSSEDIQKGVPWGPAIAKELAEAKAGVFCLAGDNFAHPWINFEAGAVSNTAWTAYVCTYLFDVARAAITGPLAQFQHTAAREKTENLKLLRTINRAQAADALDDTRLVKAFEKYWPELDAKLAQVSKAKLTEPTRRPEREMIEETLNRVRDLQQQSAALQAAVQAAARQTYEPIRYLVDSSPIGYGVASSVLGGAPPSNKSTPGPASNYADLLNLKFVQPSLLDQVTEMASAASTPDPTPQHSDEEPHKK